MKACLYYGGSQTPHVRGTQIQNKQINVKELPICICICKIMTSGIILIGADFGKEQGKTIQHGGAWEYCFESTVSEEKLRVLGQTR